MAAELTDEQIEKTWQAVCSRNADEGVRRMVFARAIFALATQQATQGAEPVGWQVRFKHRSGEKWRSIEDRELPSYQKDPHYDLRPVYTAPPPTAEVEKDAARKFQLGARVEKIKGSQWKGKVVGFYSTTLTPEGYAVESDTEKGSVQIYPASALAALQSDQAQAGKENGHDQ